MNRTDRVVVMKPKQIHQSIQNALKKAWDDTSTAVGGVEEQVSRRFHVLLDRSGLAQGSEEVQRVMTDLGQRFQQRSDEVEKKVQESVRVAISKVRDPLNEELATLKDRAEKIAHRVEAQLKRKESKEEDSD
jgi:hypothetical protein